ncbi:hypothetical protein T484DRAFT_1924846 [Baffinella frigidus]|nr:hypothetical protein T484DRAFT_1924846 [Cryptophyta sp. CCMP2293]|mmetsp:Transcript_32317/g.76785  ORF Transcript_32317/g.76785 Transcript_32317/m.76785 type:complete len:109 (+) Transcript_32317:89-415(+)
MFGLIVQCHTTTSLLGMGPAVAQDWSDYDEPGQGPRDRYFPVRDNGGDTVCYEYTSIKLQNPATQQFGCRGEFPGSTFKRVSPEPSGRNVCGVYNWDSGMLIRGCAGA